MFTSIRNMDKHFRVVRGLICFKPPGVEKHSVEYELDYQPLPWDRIMSSYPKSGNFWTINIVLSIMGDIHVGQYIPKDRYSKLFLGFRLPNELVDDIPVDRDGENCRFHATHLSMTYLAYNPGAKYLLLMRNPKDLWITGKDLPNGDYFTAIKSSWEHREDSNCTLITYEEMSANPRDSIVKIASFLGIKYVRRLYGRCDDSGHGTGSNSDDILLDRIIRETRFKAMKSNHELKMHFRKGIVGDWRAVMTRDESDLIDKRVRDEWMGTGLETLWEREMKW
ncbi:unnamed protein product [Oppiella nova]|uniref:Sulfotransferase domain-containing protein n=1 Tax=Oppiella nova TaxID=334625 RepID=A0A7R9MIU5_9ACAR|nr:unnamed protein product [Oppiella nova]CAG2178151.1 unnamed protein product [Oppiella nova]